MLIETIYMRFLLVLCLVFVSCGSNTNTSEVKCNYPYNSIKPPKVIKSNFIVAKDTLVYNEIRFTCVPSAMLSKKIMFDKFGKWDGKVMVPNETHPILIWNDVNLLEDGKLVTVIAFGQESRENITTSIMLVDESNADIIGRDSIVDESYKRYFLKALKWRKEGEKFYKDYWKMVDVSVYNRFYNK